jgi:4-hydroxy-3-methylbut-2-en-1-yl diphosphate synthase IspG/GcpE
MMRKSLFTAIALLFLAPGAYAVEDKTVEVGAHCAVSEAGVATLVGTPAPTIPAILARHPKGGPTLARAIAEALTANPRLAADVIQAARDASEPVRIGIAAGLARAVADLQEAQPESATLIKQALGCADAQTRTAFEDALAPAFAENNAGGNGGGASGGLPLGNGVGQGIGGGNGGGRNNRSRN